MSGSLRTAARKSIKVKVKFSESAEGHMVQADGYITFLWKWGKQIIT
jgi:hypothetical protein